MNLSRRTLLTGAGAAVVLGGCTPLLRESRNLRGANGPIKTAEGDQSLQVRRWNRIGYGPRPGDIARTDSNGWESVVDEQLKANQEEPPELQFQLRRLDIYQFSPKDLRALPEHEVIRQLQTAALLRAIYSPNQLRERMVEFWSDHFNIDSKKAYGAFALTADQDSVIRKHALGSFPEMVKASAHSPAMLAYLDNQVNRRGVVNENYGRELLELHTLGVRSGYTQKDVLETARCFTGWTIEDGFLKKGGSFVFDPELHEPGARVVLGHRIPAGGQEQGERVLDIATMHPWTAQHISGKIARLFLGEQAGDWPDRIAKIYLETHGDISAMLRPLLLSKEFGEVGAGLAKRPYDLVVSTVRALDGFTDGRSGLQDGLTEMGQPLYQWAMPDGYPRKTSSWTASLLARWNWALAVGYGSVAGLETDLESLAKRMELPPPQALAYAIFGHADHPLKGKDLRETVALALLDPAFQWR